MDELQDRKVVVTGANGLIGRRVARKLQECGARPVCIVRSSGSPVEDLPGRQIPMDLLGRPDLDAAMRDAEYVVHFAARSGGAGFQSASHAEVMRDNHEMTQTVLRAAAKVQVRRVFLASSAVVYRGQGDKPLNEDCEVLRGLDDCPSGYAWSKITDELLGQWTTDESGLDVVVGRFTNVYAPEGVLRSEPTTVVHALIRRALEAAENGQLGVWGDGTRVRSFVHADDAAIGVVRVLGDGRAGTVYNIDSGEAVSIRELAETVRDEVDKGLAIEFIPSYGSGSRYRVLDTTRLQSLGFAPQYSLRRGVAEVVRRCQGYL